MCEQGSANTLENDNASPHKPTLECSRSRQELKVSPLAKGVAHVKELLVPRLAHLGDLYVGVRERRCPIMHKGHGTRRRVLTIFELLCH